MSSDPREDPTGIRGRVTLITGGTGDLGRSVVKVFVEAGADVHVPVYAAREVERLADHLGDGIRAVRLHPDADLTDAGSVARVFEAVESRGSGPPEILVALAGAFRMAPVEETDPSTWTGLWEANATTAFLCARAAFPGMKARGRGRILTVSAFPALELGSPGLAAYGAAKAALLNLTRTLAREGAAHGITANAVLPSIIDTAGNREAMPDQDRAHWLDPVEIARVLLFLASDEARIVNGSALTLTLE
jgi:NAD(P)-dependent dehydrogenase (short-subunit alcohol dehydrogenase family)